MIYACFNCDTSQIECLHENFETLLYVAENLEHSDGNSRHIFNIENKAVWLNMTDLELQFVYMGITSNFNGCIFEKSKIVDIIVSYLFKMYKPYGNLSNYMSLPLFKTDYDENLELAAPNYQSLYEQPLIVSPQVNAAELKAKENTDVRVENRTPKKGVCAQIWETCEELAKNLSESDINSKAFKQNVKNILIDKGVNSSTISVQFTKWRNQYTIRT